MGDMASSAGIEHVWEIPNIGGACARLGTGLRRGTGFCLGDVNRLFVVWIAAKRSVHDKRSRTILTRSSAFSHVFSPDRDTRVIAACIEYMGRRKQGWDYHIGPLWLGTPYTW